METQNISFTLKNIELIQSNITPIDYILSPDVIFKFTINIEHLVNIKDNIIAIKPNIEIFTEENETILGTLTASLVFEFDNLSAFVIENEIKLPLDIIIAINSLSISTVRGIMFSTFKGTYLHNAFLPVIDPKAFNIH
jgi:hypothetical protein